MTKSYKYRIYPTAEQVQQIETNFSICRYVHNVALEVKQTAWRSAQIDISNYALMRQYTEAKKEFPWLGRACRSAVESALTNLDSAFRKFFSGDGYPKFKSKKSKQTFTIRKDRMSVDFTKQLLNASKIKSIPIVISRPFFGEIKRITISKTKTGKYYTAICVEIENIVPQKLGVTPEATIGIDLGVKSFAVTSDGRYFGPNQKFNELLSRLSCIHRRASRKRKGSNNRRKAFLKLALLYEKISNRRKDYIHKVTTTLIRDSQVDTFAIEDLNVTGMVKNRNVARVVADATFYEFYRQMKYKCDWHGKNLIIINRFDPSSKRCSNCGEIYKELKRQDREWSCGCGAHHDRDLNAAKNIKYYGLLKHSGEGISGEPVESRRLRRAKKQESMNN